jgi:hypothetical protein
MDMEFEFLQHKIVAHSDDRDAWLTARNTGITASNAGQLATENSIDSILKSKFYTDFVGNPATDWGIEREPILLEWAKFNQNKYLFKSDDNPRFMATPDGIKMSEGSDSIVLCQVKTSSKPLTKIPPNYYRQMQWEMFVMGAHKNLLVWEQHENFVPIGLEPVTLWIDRDEETINKLKKLAEALLVRLDEANAFGKEME